ncbi:MAG: hypothetical protein ACRD4O_18055 [Bryobacteraceae bacterium]
MSRSDPAKALSQSARTSFWIGFVPLSLDPSPDWRVLIFAATLAILTGVLFGIVACLCGHDPQKRCRQEWRHGSLERPLHR